MAIAIWGDSDTRNTTRIRRVEQVLLPLLREPDFADATKRVADTLLDAARRTGAGREASVDGTVVTELVQRGPLPWMRAQFQATLTALLAEFQAPPEQEGTASAS